MGAPEEGTLRRLGAIAVVILAMLLWPLLESLPGLMIQRYSPFEIVWVRYGTHLVLMLALWAPGGAARLVRTCRPGLHAIRAFTMLGMPASFVLANAHMSAHETMSIFWIAPLAAMVLAAVGLRESPGWRSWAAATAGYAGALAIGGVPDAVRWAAVLPLSMAACFALYLALTRLLRGETTAARLFYTALGVWLPLSLALPWFWQTPTLRDLALMMGIGLVGFLILLGLDWALDIAPVSTVAPFLLAQPVWTVLVAMVLSEHLPGRRELAGTALVLLAWLPVFWASRPGRRAHLSIA